MYNKILICLLTFLVFDSASFTMPYVSWLPRVPSVYASTLPSDADAWTENDNATYTWTCITYKDTIEFTTSDKRVGSYSLKVNHTSATTYMRIRLNVGSQQDATNYDYLGVWIKWQSSKANIHWWLSVFYNVFYADVYRVSEMVFTNNTWLKLVIPLNAFYLVESGSIPPMTWAKVQYIELLTQAGGLGSADLSTIHVDGLHFGEYSIVSVNESFNPVSVPNYFAFYPKFAEKKAVKGWTAYTSLYDFVNIVSANKEVYDIESEVLGHVLVALSMAYDKTKDPMLLDKINAYATWLSKFANSATAYGGIYKQWYNDTKEWHDRPTITTVGWAMAGLNYAYHITGNTAYSTASDYARKWFLDYMWDNPNRWYDNDMNVTSGAITDSTAWGMGVGPGASILGLASYYRLISQNTTIKTQLDSTLTKIASSPLGGLNNTFMTFGEATGYTVFGFMEAYRAFGNQTYFNWAKQLWEVQQQQYEVYGNGNNNGDLQLWQTAFQSNETWGTSTRLLDLMLLYELDTDPTNRADYEILYEKTMFDWFQKYLRLEALGLDSWAYDRWASYSKTYVPTQAWIYASLILYKYNINGVSTPFILSTDKLIISCELSRDQFRLVISALTGQTSATNICCGDKGEPRKVSGAESWIYDADRKILAITTTHSSSVTVTISWRHRP